MTPQIQLRPFTRTEYHDFFEEYEADPLMDPRPYRYRYDHVERCFDEDQARFDWYPTFGAFLENGRCVGCVSLKRIDHEMKCCEIGIILQNDSVKGCGYGTQAIKEAIRIARDSYDLRTLWAETAQNNLPMQRVLEKVGFHLVERLPYGFDMLDHWEDKLRYMLEVSAP